VSNRHRGDKIKMDYNLPTNTIYGQPVPLIQQKDNNPAVLNITEKVLRYNYGEDISKWAVIQPFTLNHNQSGNILSMFDGDLSTYYALASPGATQKTTTIIMDFGKVIDIRGLIISIAIVANGAGQSITSAWSLDGVDYTTIATSADTTSGPNYHDHVASIKQIRYLKLTGVTDTVGSELRFFQVMTIV